MIPYERKERYTVDDLAEIISLLRSKEGCPWDREQTHESIRSELIEETYEVIEAIDQKDPAMLREELGDLLLQVVFHAQKRTIKCVPACGLWKLLRSCWRNCWKCKSSCS